MCTESSRHVLCHSLDGIDEILLAGTAAEIPVKLAPDRDAIRRLAAADHVDGSHDHSRCAETALKRMMVAKRRLYGMELALARQSLDCGDVPAVRLAGEDRA